MRRVGLTVAVLLGASMLCVCQGKDACNYVVRKVWFESASGLTSEQVQKLHSLVEGRCYDPANPGSASKTIYDELRQWGYVQVEVYDPETFRVEDESVHPSPVSFVIDFRVNDLTTCPAVQPKDAGYEDAMALRRDLERNGIEVWCVGRSKMAHAFEGQTDAALFITEQGRFEALFFPPEETLQTLQVTSDYRDDWFNTTFAGTPRWHAANQTVIGKRPWYIVRSGNRLFMTGRVQLAARLESIFGPAGAQSHFVNGR